MEWLASGIGKYLLGLVAFVAMAADGVRALLKARTEGGYLRLARGVLANLLLLGYIYAGFHFDILG